MTMVNGRLMAMGRMYGPIMPVMNSIGKKERITANVARITGGRTSSMADSTASRGGSFFILKCR